MIENNFIEATTAGVLFTTGAGWGSVIRDNIVGAFGEYTCTVGIHINTSNVLIVNNYVRGTDAIEAVDTGSSFNNYVINGSTAAVEPPLHAIAA